MSNRSSPMQREPLGKLVYRQDDLNSLKCLVAIRMSKNRVDTEAIHDKKVGTTLTLKNGETLTDLFAICWYLASCDPRSKTSAAGWAKIMQWQSFSNSEVRPFLQGLVKLGHMDRRDLTKANQLRKFRLISGLDTLNQKLKDSWDNNRSLFVEGGNWMTLADVLLAVDLTPILDPGWPIKLNSFLQSILKQDYNYLRHWYDNIRNQDIFAKAFNHFIRPKAPISNKSNQPREDGDSAVNGEPVAKANNKKGRKPSESGKNSDRKKSESGNVQLDMSGLIAKPLRVLCLHGYRQNDVSFREKTGAFRKLIGKFCEFTFVKAPHHVLPMSSEDINADQRGWWFSRENDYFKADDASDCDKGFDGSLELIQKTFELHGPFDGVIGFSQGATLTALLCLIKTKNPEMLSPAVKFNFAIMVAAFKSKSTKHAHWYEGGEVSPKVSIPTLHVMGRGDRVIAKRLSDDLLDLFHEPSKLTHSGGHFIPATSKEKSHYYKFLNNVGQLRDQQQNPPAVVETLKESPSFVEKSKPLDKNQNQGCEDTKQQKGVANDNAPISVTTEQTC